MCESEMDERNARLDAALLDLFAKWREMLPYSDEEMKRLDVLYLFCDTVHAGLLRLAPEHDLDIGLVRYLVVEGTMDTNGRDVLDRPRPAVEGAQDKEERTES